MLEHGENVPGYRKVRVTAPADAAEARADEEAWYARDSYPDLHSAGGPLFGVAREREQGGWQLLPYFGSHAPQDARDSLAAHFRRAAHEQDEADDPADRDACLAAAERLDWEVIDELTVSGTRYRVVRAEQFIRMGPEGPEPPRPSDPAPDPRPPSQRRAERTPDPVDGFIIDTDTATGMSEGILKVELLSLVPGPGTVPPDVRGDALKAVHTHPGGVLLPAAFLIAERIDGRWAAESGARPTPQDAREGLMLDLRVMAPVMRKLDAAQRAEYARAADRFESEQDGVVLEVAGRHLRLARVERLVRVGPDGPEGPRPSDYDPQPPVNVHTRQLREQGLLTDDEDAEDADDDGSQAQADANARELMRLFEAENARQDARELEAERARQDAQEEAAERRADEGRTASEPGPPPAAP